MKHLLRAALYGGAAFIGGFAVGSILDLAILGGAGPFAAVGGLGAGGLGTRSGWRSGKVPPQSDTA